MVSTSAWMILDLFGLITDDRLHDKLRLDAELNPATLL